MRRHKTAYSAQKPGSPLRGHIGGAINRPPAGVVFRAGDESEVTAHTIKAGMIRPAPPRLNRNETFLIYDLSGLRVPNKFEQAAITMSENFLQEMER